MLEPQIQFNEYSHSNRILDAAYMPYLFPVKDLGFLIHEISDYMCLNLDSTGQTKFCPAVNSNPESLITY